MRVDLRSLATPVALAAAAVALAGVAVWLVISAVFSPTFVTGQLAEAVKTATGRTLTVGGAPSFTLWPDVRVTLPDVRLSNPPGMYEGQVAEARELTVTMSASALLHRRLEIADVRLESPRLSLVIDETGRANWADAPRAAGKSDPGAATAGAPLPALPPILIEDGDVRFLDQRSGKAFAATGVDLAVKLGDDGIAADIKGALDWNRDRIGFALFVKDPARLAAQGSPVDVTAQAARGSLSFSGIARMSDGLSLAGQADATVPSLRDLAIWLGAPVGQGAGFGVASMSGPLELTASRIAMRGASFTIDGMNAKGDAALIFGARPRLEVSLGMDRLDLNRWVPPAPDAKGKGETAGDPGWSDARLDFRALRGLDAKFTLAASQLAWRDMKLGTVSLSGSIAGGKLAADLTRAELYGGNASGHLDLDGSGDVPGLALRLKGDGLDALPLLRDLARIGRISGKMAAEADLRTAGTSQRDMISRLGGSANFAFSEGALRGIDVRGLNEGVAKAVLQGWSAAPADKTPFDRLEASFAISDGIAESKDLIFEGGGFRITGSGQSDLLKGDLDFRLKPVELDASGAAKTGGLNGLNLAIAVKGPWNEPRIYPDVPGILENPAAAYEQIKSLLANAKNGTLNDAGAAAIGTAADSVLPPDAAAAVKKKGQKLLDKLLKKPDPAAQ